MNWFDFLILEIMINDVMFLVTTVITDETEMVFSVFIEYLSFTYVWLGLDVDVVRVRLASKSAAADHGCEVVLSDP